MLFSDLTAISLFNTDRHGLLIQSMTADLNLIETIDFIRNGYKPPAYIISTTWLLKCGSSYEIHGIMVYAFFLISYDIIHMTVWISSLKMIKSLKNRFIIPAQSDHFFCLVTRICDNMHIWFLIPHINQINSQTQGQLISLWLNSCIG